MVISKWYLHIVVQMNHIAFCHITLPCCDCHGCLSVLPPRTNAEGDAETTAFKKSRTSSSPQPSFSSLCPSQAMWDHWGMSCA